MTAAAQAAIRTAEAEAAAARDASKAAKKAAFDSEYDVGEALLPCESLQFILRRTSQAESAFNDSELQPVRRSAAAAVIQQLGSAALALSMCAPKCPLGIYLSASLM